MCGKCCNPVTMTDSLEKIKQRNKKRFPNGLTSEDRFIDNDTFIESFWKPLTEKEISKLDLTKDQRNMDFFKCEFFKDNKCTNWNKRPLICKYYPLYHIPYMDFLIDDCGYKNKLKEVLNEHYDIRTDLINLTNDVEGILD
jgi:Fe-S-cluster containining protein